MHKKGRNKRGTSGWKTVSFDPVASSATNHPSLDLCKLFKLTFFASLFIGAESRRDDLHRRGMEIEDKTIVCWTEGGKRASTVARKTRHHHQHRWKQLVGSIARPTWGLPRKHIVKWLAKESWGGLWRKSCNEIIHPQVSQSGAINSFVEAIRTAVRVLSR